MHCSNGPQLEQLTPHNWDEIQLSGLLAGELAKTLGDAQQGGPSFQVFGEGKLYFRGIHRMNYG